MTTLYISGLAGRMGGEVARLAPAYGFTPRAFQPGGRAGVVVDFSHPDCLAALLEGELPLVIGTTGYTAAQQAQIVQASRGRPILQAANFSLGVAAMRRLAVAARQLLPGWDIRLVERHHADKQDAPSGTALALAKAVEISRSEILSVRAGTVRGVHEVGFYGREEALMLTHVAESRAVFAHGALRAARWIVGRPCGLYGVEDMLDEDWKEAPKDAADAVKNGELS